MTPTASQAGDLARAGGSVIGWKLDEAQRRELVQQFPPRYRKLVADHVTLRSKVAKDTPLPQEVEGAIVGRADDGRGVEAMVVTIDGTTDRPDGSTYHITWSLEEGRAARESNDVIAGQGWTEFALPMPLKLRAARF
jgi:hypothetical protein